MAKTIRRKDIDVDKLTPEQLAAYHQALAMKRTFKGILPPPQGGRLTVKQVDESNPKGGRSPRRRS